MPVNKTYLHVLDTLLHILNLVRVTCALVDMLTDHVASSVHELKKIDKFRVSIERSRSVLS